MTATALLQALPLQVGPGSQVSGVAGGAASWLVAQMVCQARLKDRRLPLWVVVAGRDAAADFEVDLRYHIAGIGGKTRRDEVVEVVGLPADDVKTWDGLSPHPHIPRRRLQALDLCDRRAPCVVVVPARALMQRVLPPRVLRGLRLELAPGDRWERDDLLAALTERGYLTTSAADEPGTLSWRGGVVDLWPATAPRPVRMEFFDDEIEDIREMDPKRWRSVGAVERVHILPAREAVVSARALARASRMTADAVDVIGGGHQTRRRVLRELKQGLWFPGAEDYLPVLHEVVSPLTYARGVVVVEPDDVRRALQRQHELVHTRWRAIESEERPVVLPETRFASAEEVWESLSRATRIGGLLPEEPGLDAPLRVATADNSALLIGRGELAPVAATFSEWAQDGWQVALACDNTARAERVEGLFQPHGVRFVRAQPGVLLAPGTLALWPATLRAGFQDVDSRIAIVTADEIFGARQRAHQRPPRSLAEAALSSLTELKAGDLIVHVRHGVGRFVGLKRIAMPIGRDTLDQDFAEIAYRNDDRMFLPVTRLDHLYKYRAVGDRVPRLDKLGGVTWARRKAKVRDKVAALAGQLLRLHALRTVVEGHAYVGAPGSYRRFEESFPFVETRDQMSAIDDVMADLAKPQPMDRLVVGDVGFGKTEVAMRAAMRVTLEGRQVAILCPTTVLAFQHFQTFTERFNGFGVRVELTSRYRSAAETRALSEKVRAGEVHILIGTHALLSRRTRFSDLGLVVIDEEHRFGVQQKEKLKKLAQSWSDVPCEFLALSATPIPRTLHMAMAGMREVSLIATPPVGRRAVQTRVLRWSDNRIREEILHELRRGGQVFFLHNRVQTIEAVARRIRELVPEAAVAVAHGQMAEGALEQTMVDFVQRRFTVLVCTTIIESGVDMPSVNTILVNRADQLGLAQLYQLRGRVGRSHVRGYCALLVPEDVPLTSKAASRLRVLQEHTDLGSGFAIASADLEIRGAGDLLGESQHGHIEAVGFDTYVELLEDAIGEARGDLTRSRLDPELEIPVSALLPESWMSEIDERLAAYRRLAVARTVEDVRDLIGQWEDAWGEPPPEALNLCWMAETRIRCKALGIERISWMKVRVGLDFHPSSPVSTTHIADLLRRDADRFSLGKGDDSRRLLVRFEADEATWPFRFLHWVLRRLESAT